MIYLGIDPGVRSGVAFVWVDSEEVEIIHSTEVYRGADGFIQWWDSRNSVFPLPDLIIFEGFTLREGKSGVDITPRDVIGALKALADRDGIPLVERSPSARKKQVPDLVLKKMGLYLPGEANRNAREAVRHVLAYLKAQKNPTVLEAFRG